MATRHQEFRQQQENEMKKARIAAKAQKDVATAKGVADLIGKGMGTFATMFNDLSWYSKVKNWEDYTRIPMYWDPAQWVKYIAAVTAGNVSLPLIATFKYVKTFGNTNGTGGVSNSVLNYSIVSFVTKLRSKTSVSTALDDSVFGLYLIAALEAYDLAFEIERDLRAAKTADSDNPYLGRLILANVGMSNIAENVDNIRNLYGRFRFELNRLISNVPIPKSFSLIYRRKLMRNLLVKDNNIVRPQLYMAYSNEYGYYDPSESSVKYEDLGSSISARINQLARAIQYIIEDLTMQDVLRALRSGISQSEFLTWELPGIDDPSLIVMPAYAPELLEQLHNVVTAPVNTAIDKTSLDIRTSPSGWLYQGVPMEAESDETNPDNYGVRFQVTAQITTQMGEDENSAQGNLLVNFFDEHSDAGRILEGTRLMTTFKTLTVSEPALKFFCVSKLCGFEVVHSIDITYVDQQNSGHNAKFLVGSVYAHTRTLYSYIQGAISDDGMSVTNIHDGGTLHLASCFNWFPIITMLDTEAGSKDFIKHGEICNFARMPNDTLEQLHRVACISAMQLDDPKYVH